jgi:tubulin-specific chaperone A
MSEPAAPSAAPRKKFVKPPPEDPVTKQLKIKTGTLKRNVKDLAFANSEVAKEEARLVKILADDPEKESQQKNVIQEARMMVPLAKNRIRTSLNELQEFLANETLDDAAELRAAALEAVAEGEAALAEE